MEIKFDHVTYVENKSTLLEKVYLKDVTFEIKGNKIFSIIGDSNSGISKIPELINAVLKPTKGSVIVDQFVNNGKYIKSVNKLRINVGYVKYNPDFMLFNKTVKKELSYGIKHFKYKLDKEQIRISEALTLVGLDESYLDKKICDLSMNEKKKISIASSLIFNPNIIIFEEPTIFMLNTDIEKLKKLFRLLKNKYNKTIIIITKNTDFAYEISDESLLFSDGKLISEGEILTNKTLLEKCNIDVPKIINFIETANQREANLTYTNNILDLIKEVYRNARL